MPPRNANASVRAVSPTTVARAAPNGPITRRAFVRSAAAVGGGLMLGIYLPTGKAAAQENASGSAVAEAPPRNPSAFLRIAPDDTITLVTPSVEMGQGPHTALPMILMEELGGRRGQRLVEVFAMLVLGLQDVPRPDQRLAVRRDRRFALRGWRQGVELHSATVDRP